MQRGVSHDGEHLAAEQVATEGAALAAAENAADEGEASAEHVADEGEAPAAGQAADAATAAEDAAEQVAAEQAEDAAEEAFATQATEQASTEEIAAEEIAAESGFGAAPAEKPGVSGGTDGGYAEGKGSRDGKRAARRFEHVGTPSGGLHDAGRAADLTQRLPIQPSGYGSWRGVITGNSYARNALKVPLGEIRPVAGRCYRSVTVRPAGAVATDGR